MVGIAKRRHRAGYRVADRRLRCSEAAFDHRLGQLLDEQRHAVSAIDDLIGDLLREAPCRRSRGRSPLRAAGGGRRLSVSIVTCGRPSQGGANSGRKVMIGKTRSPSTRSTSRSSNSRVVGSLQCTSSHTISTGWRAANPSTCAIWRLKGLFLALLRSEIQLRIAVAGRDRQQVGHQRTTSPRSLVALSQHRLQLVETLCVRVLATEARRPFELGDARIECAVLMMRRTEIAQPGVRLADEPLHEGLSDARFSDPGLAADQHDLPVATVGLRPAAQQQVDLLVPADQRRG